jgi:hypothetical protein
MLNAKLLRQNELARRETGHIIKEVFQYESPTAQYVSHIHNIAYENFAVQLLPDGPSVSLQAFLFQWLYSPLGPWPLIFQLHGHFTESKVPWTSDQLVARPLPKYRATQT